MLSCHVAAPKPLADSNARIDQQVEEFVKSKASSYGEGFNNVLRRLLGLDPPVAAGSVRG